MIGRDGRLDVNYAGPAASIDPGGFKLPNGLGNILLPFPAARFILKFGFHAKFDAPVHLESSGALQGDKARSRKVGTGYTVWDVKRSCGGIE